MKATRKDVAELAGVSTATVSYVLNKTKSLSPQIVEKVQLAAKQLNYTPNMVARSLATKQTHTIGIIANDLSNPLHAEVTKYIEEAAAKKNYSVMIFNGAHESQKCFYQILSRNVDAVSILAMPYRFTVNDLTHLAEAQVKLLISGFSDTMEGLEQINILNPDFTVGMDAIIKYLKLLKHKEIVYLNSFDNKSPFDNRLDCFIKSMQKHFGYERPTIINGTAPYLTDPHTGYQMTCQLLTSGKIFSAIVCTNDLMAYGCIKALSDHGFRVPEDVSVVGIDDISFSEVYNPGLTSLGFDKKVFGDQVVDMLLNDIEHNEVQHKVIATNLMIRSSCKVCSEANNTTFTQ